MRDKNAAKSHLAGQERAFTSRLHIFNWSKFKIEDIMSKHVVTAHRDDTLQSVAKKMADNFVSCVVVQDNDQVCGIITQTDLVAYASQNASNNISKIPNAIASECMKSPIQTVAPEFPILHACLLMNNQNIKRLPIISNNKLVGLVSQTDMIRALESLSALRNVESIMTINVGTISAKKNRPGCYGYYGITRYF
jgi:CBS domain-containing protein